MTRVASPGRPISIAFRLRWCGGGGRHDRWTGFAALLFMAFMADVVVKLPTARDWSGQAAYEAVFGQVPRIINDPES